MPNESRAPRAHRPPVTGSGPLATAIHILLALAGWVLFVVLWYKVFYRTPPHESAVGVLVIAGLLVISVTLTLAWIRHNVILSRRFRYRRSRVREVTPDWSRDVLGREVVASWDALSAAQEVEIDLDPAGERKIYRAS